MWIFADINRVEITSDVTQSKLLHFERIIEQYEFQIAELWYPDLHVVSKQDIDDIIEVSIKISPVEYLVLESIA